MYMYIEEYLERSWEQRGLEEPLRTIWGVDEAVERCSEWTLASWKVCRGDRGDRRGGGVGFRAACACGVP